MNLNLEQRAQTGTHLVLSAMNLNLEQIAQKVELTIVKNLLGYDCIVTLPQIFTPKLIYSVY